MSDSSVMICDVVVARLLFLPSRGVGALLCTFCNSYS